MLDTTFFAGNRKQLLEKLENDALVVVTANGMMQQSLDTSFPFRQDNNFFYLTGSEEPNLILVIDTKTADECLILPAQTEAEKYFGGVHNIAEIAAQTGITQILEQKEGWQKIKILQGKRKKIYTLAAPPVQFTRQERMFSSPARRLLIQKLKRLSQLPQEPINDVLMNLRTIKQPGEIGALKMAIAITKEGIEAVCSKLRPGIAEYELEAELDYAFKKRNSSHGFAPPIIAAGKNTTILHYGHNNAKLAKDDLLLLDIGAQISNYTADISRTYKVNGVASAREQAVFDAVMRVHAFSLNMIKPGLSWRDYILAVDEVMGKELMQLGLIAENTRSDVRKYFPHAISHSLGLDAHDPCDYTQEMKEDMVITIEPGIYIPNEAIGVRVEDDILITKNGAVNLSADIPYKSVIK